MKPTLSELQDAIPQRGKGAPARSRSHYEAILQLLRDRGPQGVLGSELYNSPEKFGRSPRNRVSELRHDGHLIEGKPHGSSDWWYRLIRDNAGEKPHPSQEPKHGPNRHDNAAWFEREFGKPKPSAGTTDSTTIELPLFDGGKP